MTGATGTEDGTICGEPRSSRRPGLCVRLRGSSLCFDMIVFLWKPSADDVVVCHREKGKYRPQPRSIAHPRTLLLLSPGAASTVRAASACERREMPSCNLLLNVRADGMIVQTRTDDVVAAACRLFSSADQPPLDCPLRQSGHALCRILSYYFRRCPIKAAEFPLPRLPMSKAARGTSTSARSW